VAMSLPGKLLMLIVASIVGGVSTWAVANSGSVEPIFLHPGSLPQMAEEISLRHALIGTESESAPDLGMAVTQKGSACRDGNVKCQEWAKTVTCGAFPAFMFTSCKKTCDMCSVSSADVKNIIKEKMALCADFVNDKAGCTTMKEDGMCEKAWVPMSLSCRTACKTGPCHDYGEQLSAAQASFDAECVDRSPRCFIWKTLGQCSANPKYMLHACSRSCGTCSLSPSQLKTRVAKDLSICADFSPHCVNWMELGLCSAKNRFVISTCRRTCNAFACEAIPHIYIKTAQSKKVVVSPQARDVELLQITSGPEKFDVPINETRFVRPHKGDGGFETLSHPSPDVDCNQKLKRMSPNDILQHHSSSKMLARKTTPENSRTHPASALAHLLNKGLPTPMIMAVDKLEEKHDEDAEEKDNEANVQKMNDFLNEAEPFEREAIVRDINIKKTDVLPGYHAELDQTRKEIEDRMEKVNDKLPESQVGTTEARCQDQHPHCSFWEGTGQCSANPLYMFRYCKKSCGKCVATDTMLQEKTISLLNACQDYSPRCGKWARAGSCVKHWLYMSFTCRATCQVGPCRNKKVKAGAGAAISAAPMVLPHLKCRDKHPMCFVWRSQGMCSTEPEKTLSQCPRSCDACGWSTEKRARQMAHTMKSCKDYHVLCTKWQLEGKCNSMSSFMQATCRRSCKACPSRI